MNTESSLKLESRSIKITLPKEVWEMLEDADVSPGRLIQAIISYVFTQNCQDFFREN